jgi:hypothetical protein
MDVLGINRLQQCLLMRDAAIKMLVGNARRLIEQCVGRIARTRGVGFAHLPDHIIVDQGENFGPK